MDSENKKWVAFIISLFIVSLFLPIFAEGTSLGISEDKFTMDGKETFLLGVSAFDAVGKIRDSDIDYLSKRGYNLIRVWLYWRDLNVAYDSQGNLLPEKEAQLKDLIQKADERGMIVDVTLLFLYEGYEYQPFGTNIDKMKRAVRSVAGALKDYDNVLFDIMNEHDHEGNKNTPHSTIKTLMDEIKSIDPDRIVTVSSTGKHILDDSNNLQTDNILAEVNDVGVDVLTPHLYRGNFPETKSRVGKIKAYLKSIGKDIPVYLQEEHYYPAGGSLNDFVRAVTEAKQSGAAGWIFHQQFGFDLTTSSFYDNAGPDGRNAIETIGRSISGTGGGNSPYCDPFTDSIKHDFENSNLLTHRICQLTNN